MRRARWLVCALLLLPAGAGGAVRVDQDEVIFSLHAPDAQEVYLVGDFNQWNPTVEPMNRVEDRFEIGLFLVAGTYRYKFVVDGETIVDPDNPGRSPQKGSPLALVERSGGLILSTDLPDEAAPAARAQFGGRYIGRFLDDDGEGDNAQRVDGFVTATLDRLRARAVVATHDSSWTWSPAALDAFFDRGFVDVSLGRLAVRGFENDTTWASSDPMGLVGDAGVFGYEAGFRRHGVAATAASSAAALRATYADVTSRYTGAIPAPSYGDFVTGAGTDTTVYGFAPTFDGSDMIALEGTLKLGDARAGYTFREERGVNPGRVVEVTRTGAGFTSTTYATRENRNASSLWLSYHLPRDLRLRGAYGWGGMTVQAFAVASDSGAVPPATFPGAGAPLDATSPLGDTDRAVVTLGTRGDGALLRWDWTRFDYDGVAGTSRAEVNRATLRGQGVWRAWTLTGSAEYTRARYGATPDGLHIDWTEQNVWLSLWDDFDAERLAAVEFDTYTVFRAGAAFAGERVDGALEAAAVAQEVADRLAQASVRGRAEWRIRGAWRAQADVRAAWYDGARWFAAGYLEAGYRRGWLDANVGFGFDPDAFDPVISDYAGTARERLLRGALDPGFGRSRAADIAAGVRAGERSMEESRAIKVEIVVRLP